MSRYGTTIGIIAALVVSFVVASLAARHSRPQPGAAPAALTQHNTDAPSPQTLDRDGAERHRAIRNADIVTVNDVVYATVEIPGADAPLELTMDTAFARQSDGAPMPVVVYIHGGGFRSGSKTDGRPFSAALARGGYFAASISYRLSDVAGYPAAVHDCKAAIRFLRANAEELAIDPNRIGVWGHSAGGHLAAYLAVTGNAPETHGEVGDHDEVSSAVACAVPISGIFDFSQIGNGGERMRYWLGEATGEQWQQRLRDASPISWVDADDPPMLLIHGTDDRLVQDSQSREFHAALQSDGVDASLKLVEGQGHIIRDRRVYLDALRFFDQHLGGAAAPARESQKDSPAVRDIPS